MKVLLRCVAIWLGLLTLTMGPLILMLTIRGGSLAGASSRAVLAFGCLAAIPVAAAIGAIQLWRLTDIGRKAAIGVVVLFVAFGALQGGTFGVRAVVGYAILVSLLGLLLSDSARRLCAAPSTSTTDV